MSRKLLLALVVMMALVLPVAGSQASPAGPEEPSVESGATPMPLPPPGPAHRATWTPAVAVAPETGTAEIAETAALEPDCRGYAITINGTDGNDTITGTASADVIHGQGGNDTIHGVGGNDIICGGAGNDSLDGDAGDDTLDGGAGDDGLGGGDGNDSLSGGDGNDGLSGGPGDDTIDGGPGWEWVYYYSAAGPVTLSLATGTATGEGNDVLIALEGVMGSYYDDHFTAGPSGNAFGGEAGNDTLIGGEGRDEAGYWWAPGPVTADLTTGTASGQGNDTLTSIENLFGSMNYADHLTGNDSDNNLAGSGGNDTLVGRGGNDRLYGHEGDDSLDGGAGADYFEGGTGNDTINGGEGTDEAAYWNAPGPVNADLTAGTATGEGNDTLTGIENLTGSGVYGDHLVGDRSDNVLNGSRGPDTLSGGGGNDHLYGWEDDDDLYGGPGTDYLDGGTEIDTCRNGETVLACEATPTLERAVIFIQGINSVSGECGGTFRADVDWIKEFLTTKSWVTERVSLDGAASFAYFSYAGSYPSTYCDAVYVQPQYGKGDTCNGVPAAADKLGALIDWMLVDQGAEKVDLVAHSMGGMVATYWLHQHPEMRSKVNSVVTFDSPLRGVPNKFIINDFPEWFPEGDGCDTSSPSWDDLWCEDYEEIPAECSSPIVPAISNLANDVRFFTMDATRKEVAKGVPTPIEAVLEQSTTLLSSNSRVHCKFDDTHGSLWRERTTGGDLIECWELMRWPPAEDDGPTLRTPDGDAKAALVGCAVASLSASECIDKLGQPYQPPAVLPGPSPAGTTELPVASGTFPLGSYIVINPGMPNEEANQVAAVGSIILASPLQFEHGAGEPIVQLLDSDHDAVLDSSDNCPLVANPGQENADATLDNGPGIPGDDTTIPNAVADSEGDACESDGDADNDGLSDSEDINPLGGSGICAAFAGASDSHPHPAGGDVTNDDNHNGDPALATGADTWDNGPSWDTDNDGALDGVECTLGTNPRIRTDRPSTADCGGSGDTDGDGLLNAWETCGWGTSATVVDSDGDGRGDCKEAADLDGNGTVDFVGDTIYYAKAVLLPSASFGKTMDFDINKNGLADFVGDVMQEARFALITGLCK